MDDMVGSLIQELIMRQGEATLPIQTIYFGGGTPSMLRPKQLQQMIAAVYANYSVVPKPEISLEVNPDDITQTYLVAVKNAGVNRLSIGIQSFNNEELVLIEVQVGSYLGEDDIVRLVDVYGRD